jgi:hypothetical protein
MEKMKVTRLFHADEQSKDARLKGVKLFETYNNRDLQFFTSELYEVPLTRVNK